MAEIIQFNCPACGTTLRLPFELAAYRGPCPSCGREIVAPDPARGLSACEPPPPLFPEPFAEPAAESTATPAPAPLIEPPPSDETEPPATPPVQLPTPSASPQRLPLVAVSILLTGAISLVAGYLLGIQSEKSRPLPTVPFQTISKEAPSPPAMDPVPTPAPTPSPPAQADPIIPSAPEPAPQPMPVPVPEPPVPQPIKTSAVAEAALKAFLDAPDWTTRSAHVLHPETTRQAMEEYSRQVPDGPTPYQSISIQNSYTDKKSGNTLFIFQVITEQHPSGIPVAVSETSSGWLIDWQTFVEFRDDLFRSFADGPTGKTGRFHLIVSAPPPPRAAKTENEHFATFLLEPPLPGRQRLAYVRKTAEIHSMLSAATQAGAAFTPVLELSTSESPDGKSYLEITDMVATDWLPKDP